MQNVICTLRGAILFVGNLPDLAYHSTVTSAAVVGLDFDIRKRVRGFEEWISARCFVFDGTLSHETIFTGTVGILFADPGSEIGAILIKEAGSKGLSANPPWAEELISTCFEIFNSDSTHYLKILKKSFPFNRLSPTKDIQDDDRLMQVLQQLINSPEDTISVEALATGIGMSPSWLQHEFKNVVGLPLRAFRKWFRIKSALIALKEGASLSEAALSAGFYDQAHFTNVFREIFGISPSVVFGKGEPIRWYIQNEEIE